MTEPNDNAEPSGASGGSAADPASTPQVPRMSLIPAEMAHMLTVAQAEIHRMSDETTPQDEAAMSPASAGSTVSIGRELADRLRAFNDRLLYGQSFERITRIRCEKCNGTGMPHPPGHPAGMSMCLTCGGNGAREMRERIDPLNVSYYGDGRVVIRDQ